eukprot:2837085-Rhodomonas_salina.1
MTRSMWGPESGGAVGGSGESADRAGERARGRSQVHRSPQVCSCCEFTDAKIRAQRCQNQCGTIVAVQSSLNSKLMMRVCRTARSRAKEAVLEKSVEEKRAALHALRQASSLLEAKLLDR